MPTPEIAQNTLTAKLREQTRAAHDRVEAILNLSPQRLTLPRYRSLLIKWQQFFSYWEPSAVANAPADVAEFIQSRSKLAWLKADLKSLAAQSPQPVEIHFDLPVRTIADVLGSLYVVEGSTLGGQVLRKLVTQQLELQIDQGVQFFNAYGTQTAVRWQQTQALLNDPRWENGEPAIIAAARQTFDTLSDHFADL